MESSLAQTQKKACRKSFRCGSLADVFCGVSSLARLFIRVSRTLHGASKAGKKEKETSQSWLLKCCILPRSAGSGVSVADLGGRKRNRPICN